jgi:hypothetical protein
MRATSGRPEVDQAGLAREHDRGEHVVGTRVIETMYVSTPRDRRS